MPTGTKKPNRVLVLGDGMVDSYLTTSPVGISDEAAVVVVDWHETQHTLGGMLNVAASLVGAGFAEVHTACFIGDDEAGQFMRAECERLGLHAHWFSDGRPTIEKARVVADTDYLSRLDWESEDSAAPDITDQVIMHVADTIRDCDVLVISDYEKGLITEALAKRCVELARQTNVPILVDTKPRSMTWFKDASLFVPNCEEATEAAARLNGTWTDGSTASAHNGPLDGKTLNDIGCTLVEKLNASVLITRSADGMSLIEPGNPESTEIAGSRDLHVLSTSGAGDVVLAVMAYAAACGLSWTDGMQLAQSAAARVVTREGTCCLMPGDLITAD